MNENDVVDDIGIVDAEIIEDITPEEIEADLKSIDEMKANAPKPVKPKGLRHTVSKNAAIKRTKKIKMQKQSRKANRGK